MTEDQQIRTNAVNAAIALNANSLSELLVNARRIYEFMHGQPGDESPGEKASD